MRLAPPVSVLCQGRGWHGLQLGVYALTAAVLAAWMALYQDAATAAALALALAAAAWVLALAWRPLRAPAVELRWDGQQWSADGLPVLLEVMHLSSRAALLRLRGPGVARWPHRSHRSHRLQCCWIAVGAADAGPHWHGMRVALLATPGLAQVDAHGRAG